MKLALGIIAGLTAASVVNASEYIVKYRNPYSIQAFGANQSFQVLDIHDQGQIMKVNINDKMRANALVQLVTDPNVEYVVPNLKVSIFKPIQTQGLRTQWAIDKVQAAKAWALGGKGSKSVVVAVIDTGVDANHESLKGNILSTGYDFAGNDSLPDDEVGNSGGGNPGHGTHCAGIIGATGLVEQGTVGIAPNISIMPIRFLDSKGQGDLFNGAKSIDYAVKQKVDVISASWGMTVPAGQESQVQPIIDAISRAEAAGIPFVVAASNDGKNNDQVNVMPANAPFTNVISVAASDVNDNKPSWSNYGKKMVALASPGNEIMSTLPKNTYKNLSGTSMATPMVAGLVGLIKSNDPGLKAAQIKSLLQATGDHVSIETACDCRIDALNAVDTVVNKKMFISPFAATVEVGKTLQFETVYGAGNVTYSSSNPSLATVDANGLLTAVAKGEVQITAKDSAGHASTSYKIYIGQPASDGGGGSTPPGGGGSCQFGDEATCQAMCSIVPSLPWCKQ